jgi:hypothetical protein
MYIATGTKLVTFDGTTFSVVTPYAPTPLEALYVGLNGLAESPETFIQNGVSTVPKIQGVKMEEEYYEGTTPKYRHAKYGLVNQLIRVTAYYTKAPTDTLEFKYSWKKETDKDQDWTLHTDWTTSDTLMFSTGYEGIIQVKVEMRKVGSEVVIETYIIPKYLIKSTPLLSINATRYLFIGKDFTCTVIRSKQMCFTGPMFKTLNTFHFQIPSVLRMTVKKEFQLSHVIEIHLLYSQTPLSKPF